MLIQIYYIILFARIILSWFMFSVPSGGGLASIYSIVYNLTEPLLAPLRKILPMIRIGMGYLDLSPFVLLILLQLLRQIIYRNLYF